MTCESHACMPSCGLIQGRFVIFDLDSMGGTFVNDVAVSSHVLNPGDVIRLAGVPLVYGLEEDLPDWVTPRSCRLTHPHRKCCKGIIRL